MSSSFEILLWFLFSLITLSSFSVGFALFTSINCGEGLILFSFACVLWMFCWFPFPSSTRPRDRIITHSSAVINEPQSLYQDTESERKQRKGDDARLTLQIRKTNNAYRLQIEENQKYKALVEVQKEELSQKNADIEHLENKVLNLEGIVGDLVSSSFLEPCSPPSIPCSYSNNPLEKIQLGSRKKARSCRSRSFHF